MWIAMTDSFVSAVQDRNDPSRLVVRARKAEHLERLFPDREVTITPEADYVARVPVPRDEFVKVMARRIEEIGYDNFKASVDDERLHDLYADFWSLHRRYQEQDRRPDRSGHLGWGEGVSNGCERGRRACFLEGALRSELRNSRALTLDMAPFG